MLEGEIDISKEIWREASSVGHLSVASVQNKNTQKPSMDASKLELLAWRIVEIDLLNSRHLHNERCFCFSSALAFFSRLRFRQRTSDTIVMLIFVTGIFIGPTLNSVSRTRRK
jgi:hypothetical protein